MVGSRVGSDAHLEELRGQHEAQRNQVQGESRGRGREPSGDDNSTLNAALGDPQKHETDRHGGRHPYARRTDTVERLKGS